MLLSSYKSGVVKTLVGKKSQLNGYTQTALYKQAVSRPSPRTKVFSVHHGAALRLGARVLHSELVTTLSTRRAISFFWLSSSKTARTKHRDKEAVAVMQRADTLSQPGQ